MPDLSIIIPFYNETAYLRAAIQSVISQGLSVQVIVVNDNPEHFGENWFAEFGLPDGVEVIHQPHNQGLSAARNTGLRAATGTYVGFLDADDYYTSGGLADQFDMAVQTSADITHAPCYLSAMGTPAVEVLRRDKLFFMTPRATKGLLSTEEAQFITSSWSSLYRRDFLASNALWFDEEQPKFEDRLFVLHTVTAAKHISYLGTPARVWRRRAGSISVTKTDLTLHRLQVQLLEKCLRHIRSEVAQVRLPQRFEKRELFNSVSRLIWDMDILPLLAKGDDPDYQDLGHRIQTLLGTDSFSHEIFDDPVLTQISRVGMKTRKGRITREMFFQIHKALREGDFQGALDTLANAAPSAAPLVSTRTPLRKTLVLHLGMHKTGSTYLQHNILAHRDALLRRGILVPQTGFDSQIGQSVRAGGLPGHQGLLTALRQNDEALWDELHREVSQSNAAKVLISCENMLHPMSEDRDKALDELMSSLSFFEDRIAIAFVRRPDTQIETYWRELVSNGNRMGARSLPEFVNDAVPRLTDLEGLFSPFETFTGKPVRLADYDAATDQNTLWDSFMELAGLGPPLPAQDVPKYPTPDRRITELARLANATISDAAQRQDVLQSLYAVSPSINARQSALPPSERLAIVTAFGEHDPAFAQGRGYGPDPQIWTEGLEAEQDWKPQTQITTQDFETLINARFAAERPKRSKPEQETTVRRIYVPRRLRIRLRPWVKKLLGL